MPISSVIIRTQKSKTQTVVDKLKTYKQTTVEDVCNENIVVVTETNSRTEDKELWNKFESIDGVYQCDLIYHNFEDEEGFDYDK